MIRGKISQYLLSNTDSEPLDLAYLFLIELGLLSEQLSEKAKQQLTSFMRAHNAIVTKLLRQHHLIDANDFAIKVYRNQIGMVVRSTNGKTVFIGKSNAGDKYDLFNMPKK